MARKQLTQVPAGMLQRLRRDFSISTPVPVPVLTTWLAPHMASGRRPLYPGQLDHQGFRVRRRIRYRNQFRPWITGRFVPNAEGAQIEVAMVPPTLPVLLFGFFLLMAVGSIPMAVLGATAAAIRGELESTIRIIANTSFSAVIGIGAAAIMWRLHKFEMQRSESEIRRMLNGYPPTNQ